MRSMTRRCGTCIRYHLPGSSAASAAYLINGCKRTAWSTRVGRQLRERAGALELLCQDCSASATARIIRYYQKVVQVCNSLANAIALPKDPAPALDPLSAHGTARQQEGLAHLR